MAQHPIIEVKGVGQESVPVALSRMGFAFASEPITRPNDTSAYAANDVIGPSASVSAAIELLNIAPPGGGEILLTSSFFERDVAALIAGETSYLLHLYNAYPESTLADNVAHDLSSARDRAAYLGSINLGTPVDIGSTLYIAQDGINKQVTALRSSLWGYLVTVGAYTPVALTVHRFGLHSVRV